MEIFVPFSFLYVTTFFFFKLLFVYSLKGGNIVNMTSRCSLLPVVTSVVSVTWLQVGILLDLCSVVTTGLNHGESQSNKQTNKKKTFALSATTVGVVCFGFLVLCGDFNSLFLAWWLTLILCGTNCYFIYC